MRPILAMAVLTGICWCSPSLALSQDQSTTDQIGQWVSLFDGETLRGWHVSPLTGHSAASENKSGGRWVVEDGAIVGSQDQPGNGGIILTDAEFADFEVIVEMKNDFGPDSGLFLRSTEDGRAYQALIDYHADGTLMGLFGEGLDGKPDLRNFYFEDHPSKINLKTYGNPEIAFPVLPDSWPTFWRHGEWNELRARIAGGELPQITTWINGVKISEWTETEARHPWKGHIGLQVHGGGDPKDYDGKFVRYRGIRVKRLN